MTPEAMAALHREAFDETPRPWAASEFAEMLAAQTTVAVSRDEGFALGRVAGPEAELLTLAVAQGMRRSGLGAALVVAFEAAAAARGAEESFLEVAEGNAAARALYKRLGYAEAGLRPEYYPRTGAAAATAIVMRKSLASGTSAAPENARVSEN
jgi:[ribosomal protein S18]-alanine N-acetyltransferase